MFQEGRLDIVDSLTTTELDRSAAEYARRVADGEYEFNSFAESKGYESQEEKIDLSKAYESLLTHESQPITEAEDYIPAVAAELEFEDDIFVNAFNTLEEARRNNIYGSKPQSFAAGIVYTGLLLKQERMGRISTQEEIADTAGVSTPALRRNFKEIFDEYTYGDFEINWL